MSGGTRSQYFCSILFSLNFAGEGAWAVEGVGSIQRGRFSFDFIEFANKERRERK